MGLIPSARDKDAFARNRVRVVSGSWKRIGQFRVWDGKGAMNQKTKESRLVVIRRIFFAQLCLVAAFSILAIIGYFWQVGTFFFALFLGSLGGSIGLLRRVRGEKPAIIEELAADMTSTLMPILYGGLMAGVAYLLFMSALLSGESDDGLFTSNLFPNFTKAKASEANLIKRFMDMEPLSMKDVGKLLVWCFVAGYSESFVTGILKQLESRSEGAQ